MEAYAQLYQTDTADRRRQSHDAPIERLIATFKTWAKRRRQRLELSGVDDALLRDMGISRSDAAHEIAKPFWRA